MIRNLITFLLLTIFVSSCSSHQEPPASHEGTTLTDCYTPVSVGNFVGAGVNGQPRNWGSDGRAVKPALDMLVNDLGANFFRVELNNGSTDWETTNDDASPSTFNWTAYDAMFSSPAFADTWDYIRYLNQLGVAHVELAQHGGLPAWMGTVWPYDGRAHTLSAAQEDEFVETCVAVLMYARTRAPEPRPHFDLFSPFNEPEYSPPEGISFGTTNPQIQEARVVRKLVDRMNALPDLAGIQLVVGEHANVEGMVGDRSTLLADSVIAARLAATSFHRYGDAAATDWAGANPPVFLSEFNSDSTGVNCFTTTWTMAMQASGNLISALQGGVTGALAWADTDAPHVHQFDEFQTWGLLAAHSGSLSESGLCGHFNNTQPADSVLDAMTYTPKPTYWALRHAFRFIRPNASKIPVSDSSSSVDVTAWKNADGTVAVFGRNTGSTANVTVTLTMSNPPSYLTPRTSTASSTDVVGSAVPLTNGSGVFSLPAQSVFTLLSSPGSGGTGGAAGMGGMSAGGTSGSAGAASGNGGQGGASGSNSAGTDQGGMSGSGGASAGASGTDSTQGGASGQSGAPSGGQSGGGQGGASAGAGGASGSSSGGAGAGGQAGASGAAGSGGSVSMPNLIAGWSFDEGSGTVAHDATVAHHDGTVASGVTWTTTGCKFGGCLSFPGTSGKRVAVPDANDLDLTQNFTLMAWVLPSNVTPYRAIMIKEESAGLVYLMYAAPKESWLDFGGGDVELGLASGNLSTTNWTHVAFTYDGSSAKTWINGAVVATSSASGNVKASTGVLGIGGHAFWGGEWFAGKIDQPEIWGGAMTAAQVSQAMGAGL